MRCDAPARRRAFLGCGSNPVFEPHAPRSRKSSADGRTAFGPLRYRIRGPGHGGTREAGRKYRRQAATRVPGELERSDLPEKPPRRSRGRPDRRGREVDGRRGARDLQLRSRRGRCGSFARQGCGDPGCGGVVKRALVTGGSGEIGAAVCKRLASDGCHVYVHARSRLAQAEKLAAEIVEKGGSAAAVAFDVADREKAEAALQELLGGGPIQIVVNNAGIHDDAVMPGMRPEQLSRVIDVSLNGFFNVTQPLLMPMIGTRWGRIVNVSSVAALAGNRGQTNYAAAKAGLHGATKALALELASRGITVNAVAPGIIESASTLAVEARRIQATAKPPLKLLLALTSGLSANTAPLTQSNFAKPPTQKPGKCLLTAARKFIPP